MPEECGDGRMTSEPRDSSLSERAGEAHKAHSLLELGDQGGIYLLHQVNRFTDLIFCCFTVSRCSGIDVLSQISCLKYHIKLE